jgi:[acyl-carrier-protein] S-malonyltransferase
MSRRVALLFPGQGAQYVGMGRAFYDSFPVSAALFNRADELLGFSFSKLIFEGSQEALTATSMAQPALYVTSLAMLAALREVHPDLEIVQCAGLSLGEYTALTAAGWLKFEEGLLLVKERAALMERACARHPGSMRAVLGLPFDEVAKVAIECGVSPANDNCPGQVVISGCVEGLEAASVRLKECGAKRVIPLDVAGAFHSALMHEAEEELLPLLRKVELNATPVQVAMNVPGALVHESEAARHFLVKQITSPVRWQESVRAMRPDLFLEVGPGKVLSGLNRKIGPSVPTHSIEQPSDFEAIQGAYV